MDEARDQIDPEGRYPADGFLTVEQNALRLMHLWHGWTLERTRDVIQLSLGGEMGVVAVVTAEAFEFRLPCVEWTKGAYGPAGTSRMWKRIASGRVSDVRLRALIEAALDARAAQYTTCRYCGQRVPPEHRYADYICHGCASDHLGVVY